MEGHRLSSAAEGHHMVAPRGGRWWSDGFPRCSSKPLIDQAAGVALHTMASPGLDASQDIGQRLAVWLLPPHEIPPTSAACGLRFRGE